MEQTMLALWKEKFARRAEPRVQRGESGTTENYSQALRPSQGICNWTAIARGFRIVHSFLHAFCWLPFGTGIFRAVTLCLFPHCMLGEGEQVTCFFHFRSPKNYTQGANLEEPSSWATFGWQDPGLLTGAGMEWDPRGLGECVLHMRGIEIVCGLRVGCSAFKDMSTTFCDTLPSGAGAKFLSPWV